MTVRIERITVDDEPRRRFFLLAEVTFRSGADDGDNYYEDDELATRVTGWMSNAVDDRDDGPAVEFHVIPEILDVDIHAVAADNYPGHKGVTF